MDDLFARRHGLGISQEDLIAVLWEQSSDAMALSDADGIVIAANQAYYQLYGFSPTQVVGHSFALIFPDEQRPLAEQQYREVFASSENPPRFESIIRRADGTTQTVESQITFLTRGEERVAMLSIIRNITDQRQAELALRESEDRLRLAIVSTNIGTWDFNPISGVLRWDARCKQLFGLPPDAEVTYETFLAGVHPNDRAHVDTVVQQALDPNGNGEYDIEYRTIGLADGVERWVAAKGKAFFNGGSRAVRFIGTVIDITERKRAEQERTQLLLSEQRARAEAQEAVRMRDSFLTVASHELRNPLTILVGTTQLLQRRAAREGNMAERDRQAIGLIAEQAGRMHRLIEELFDVSRIEAGQLSIERRSLDLAELTRRVVAQFQPSLTSHRLTYQAPAHALPIQGDDMRLTQVLDNLISNAIKYSPHGGEIVVRAWQDGAQACLSVADQGIGIPADDIPQLFERFYRAKNASLQNIHGIGIGLYVVREIVTLHGGTIAVDSGEGRGSTFTIYLPAATD